MLLFYVYILECSDNSYYIGHTDNLEKRIAEHNEGKYAGYTTNRLPIKLKYIEEFSTRAEALEVEHKLKRWSRKKKKALIEKDWERLALLSKKIFKNN